MGESTTSNQPPDDRIGITQEHWLVTPERALYMRGFWWEVVLNYGEWIAWPATTLHKFVMYGPFKSIEDGMYWVENVFFADGGDFEKKYPNTGE